MPVADDLSLLENAAHAAGDIARKYWKQAPETWDKPGGLGPVSEADLAVDAMLREELTGARPGYGWLSEETEDSPARLDAECVFIIDPIDGTRAYLEGSSTWAHSLAVARGGRITAAIVYLPIPDKMYAATLGSGAFLNGKRISASNVDSLEDANILAARPTFDAKNWQDGMVPPVKPQFRPSLAYRMGLVGEGRFDAMLALRPTWEWDIAAGALIVSEAGGRATDRNLAKLRFNNASAQVNGVVAAGKTMHQTLGTRLLQV